MHSAISFVTPTPPVESSLPTDPPNPRILNTTHQVLCSCAARLPCPAPPPRFLKKLQRETPSSSSCHVPCAMCRTPCVMCAMCHVPCAIRPLPPPDPFTHLPAHSRRRTSGRSGRDPPSRRALPPSGNPRCTRPARKSPGRLRDP